MPSCNQPSVEFELRVVRNIAFGSRNFKIVCFVEQTFVKKLQSWAAPSLPGYIGALYLCVCLRWPPAHTLSQKLLYTIGQIGTPPSGEPPG